MGNFVTDVGEFTSEDPILDQYEEGKYRGRLLISNISPSSNLLGGKVVIELHGWLTSSATRRTKGRPDPLRLIRIRWTSRSP